MISTTVTLDQAQARARHIPHVDFKPCAEAFIDRRNPNSEGKLNYSFIGPGVAQSATQEVNISEAHGFNVGGVSLPADRINNLHLHFTSEVFINAAGKWEFIWGNCGEASASCAYRDLFAIPTWIFRGFYNRSDDDAFMFAVLGGDDTGGIIWNPQVLADAKQAGMRLSASGQVIDLTRNEKLPDGETYLDPLPAAEMAKLPEFTPAQIEAFIARWQNLQWRDDALPNGGQMSCALGYGMTASRHHYPQITVPQGFSLEWLRLAPAAATGLWHTDRRQVAIVFEGNPAARCNLADAHVDIELAKYSLYSFVPNSWRELRNDSERDVLILLINGGNDRLRPTWDPQVIERLNQAGYGFDADGFIAPLATLAVA